jgi:hypothetical protein
MPEKPYITIEAADEKVHFVADQLTEADRCPLGRVFAITCNQILDKEYGCIDIAK